MDNINTLRRRILKLGFKAALLWPVALHANAIKIGDKEINNDQFSFLSVIANTILPKTDIRSATDVNAHIFALNVVLDASDKAFSNRFFMGLNLFHRHYKSVLENQTNLDANTALANLITELLPDSDIDSTRLERNNDAWFIKIYRNLLIVGWVLNKEVAKSKFRYSSYLGPYQPSTDDKHVILTSNLDKVYL